MASTCLLVCRNLKSAVYGMLTQRHHSSLLSAPLSQQQGNLVYFPLEAKESSRARKTIREQDSRNVLLVNFLNLRVRIRLSQTDLSIERHWCVILRAGTQRRVLQNVQWGLRALIRSVPIGRS